MVDAAPVPAVSTSEHLPDALVADISKKPAAAPLNPHSQRLLAASLKPTKAELKKDGNTGKGTAAKTKAKKKPAGHAKNVRTKTHSAEPDLGSCERMSNKEISGYYSGTKKWFMDRWD